MPPLMSSSYIRDSWEESFQWEVLYGWEVGGKRVGRGLKEAVGYFGPSFFTIFPFSVLSSVSQSCWHLFLGYLSSPLQYWIVVMFPLICFLRSSLSSSFFIGRRFLGLQHCISLRLIFSFCVNLYCCLCASVFFCVIIFPFTSLIPIFSSFFILSTYQYFFYFSSRFSYFFPCLTLMSNIYSLYISFVSVVPIWIPLLNLFPSLSLWWCYHQRSLSVFRCQKQRPRS
jgi:hypothetical protein